MNNFKLVLLSFIFIFKLNAQSDTAIFDDYPWLSDLIDVNNCSDETVSVYNAGSFVFLWLDNGIMPELYFQDGSFYCADFMGFSCLETYGLMNASRVWECQDCICPAVVAPVCGVDNITYGNECLAECAGVMVLFDGPCDEQPTDMIFQNFPFLNDIVDQNDCEGVVIEVYEFGSSLFPFVIVEGIGTLYSDTGQLYCQDFPGFSCLDAYGLILPVSGWNCEPCVCDAEYDPVCGVDGITYSNACIAACAGIEVDYQGECEEPPVGDEIFEMYPFLLDILHPADCGDSGGFIEVYQLGTYIYINVYDGQISTLYTGTGDFYCHSYEGFSCVEAYGLGSDLIINSWSCESNIDGISCSESSFTISRPEAPNADPNGPYFPGEILNICYKIEFQSDSIGQGNNCNWLHGLIPIIDGAWENRVDWLIDSYSPNAFTAQYGWEGDEVMCHDALLEYDPGNGNLTPGTSLPWGWWSVSAGQGDLCSNDGHPNNGWGLPAACGASNTVEFCFDMPIDECEGQTGMQSISLEMFAFADGETGCWTNVICSDPPASFHGLVDCSSNLVDNSLENRSIVADVYPNPSTGLVNIEFAAEIEDLKISVYNSDGKQIKIINSPQIVNRTIQFKLDQKLKGIHFIEIKTQSKIEMKKVIVF